jgi:hypothetical protein
MGARFDHPVSALSVRIGASFMNNLLVTINLDHFEMITV